MASATTVTRGAHTVRYLHIHGQDYAETERHGDGTYRSNVDGPRLRMLDGDRLDCGECGRPKPCARGRPALGDRRIEELMEVSAKVGLQTAAASVLSH